VGTAASFPACYRDAAVADNPVSYWRLDETSGTTAADSKGSNPGTYVNGPLLGQTGALPDAISNRAASLDGVNDRIDVPASASLNVASQITIEAWIYPTDTASVHPIVEYADSSTYGVHLWQYDDGTKLFANVMDATGNGNSVMSGPVFQVNTWYHVALTYNGSIAVLYVNGTEVARVTVGALTLSTNLPVNVGRRPVVGDYLQDAVFAGKLDEVAIYGTAMTAAKIRSHYNAGRCYKDAILADSPVGYWRLAETSGTTAADGIAGRHGTYTNGPTLNQTGALNGDTNPAVSFDGVDDRVVVPYTSALNPAQFTVEAWARPTGGTNTNRAVASTWYANAGTTRRGYWLGANSSNQWVLQIADGSGHNDAIGPAPTLNTWTHLVGTYDGTTARLYVNGILANSAAATLVANTTEPFTSGETAFNGGWTDPYPGRLDEVAVYNTVLSQTRIQVHYLLGRSYLDCVLDSTPVSYWRLGEASGTSAADSKGSNTGTYVGSPTLGRAGALAGDSDSSVGVNSTSQNISVPDSASLKPAQISVEAWVKPDSATIAEFDSPLMKTSNDNWTDGYGFFYRSSGTTLGFFVSSWGVNASATIALDRWTHVVGTYDGTTLSLYLNGTLANSRSWGSGITHATNALYIGSGATGSGTAGPAGYFWGGSLDDVAIYNKALTAAEVQLHYDSGRQ
jgi:hypothetical protein